MSDVTLIVCGAPLTAGAPDLIRELLAGGWRPTVVGTPGSVGWLDLDAVMQLISERPRFEFRAPSTPKRGGPPSAVVVCPATFNTVNKAAAGIADTYALGVLCEAISTRTPTVIVPMVSTKLSGHPAWPRSVAILVEAGVVFLDVQAGASGTAPLASGTGLAVAEAFDPRWVTAALRRLRG